MLVKELMERLAECDPDANVMIAVQPTYPFENSVKGVVVREDFFNKDDDELDDGKKLNDVLILEGNQLRYGTRQAWKIL